jgi:hypothetical protein
MSQRGKKRNTLFCQPEPEKCEAEFASNVDHPTHYNTGTIETIEFLESLNVAEDFCVGNAIKYLSRYKHKGKPLEDLEKALWYVERAIQNLEKESE